MMPNRPNNNNNNNENENNDDNNNNNNETNQPSTTWNQQLQQRRQQQQQQQQQQGGVGRGSDESAVGSVVSPSPGGGGGRISTTTTTTTSSSSNTSYPPSVEGTTTTSSSTSHLLHHSPQPPSLPHYFPIPPSSSQSQQSQQQEFGPLGSSSYYAFSSSSRRPQSSPPPAKPEEQGDSMFGTGLGQQPQPQPSTISAAPLGLTFRNEGDYLFMGLDTTDEEPDDEEEDNDNDNNDPGLEETVEFEPGDESIQDMNDPMPSGMAMEQPSLFLPSAPSPPPHPSSSQLPYDPAYDPSFMPQFQAVPLTTAAAAPFGIPPAPEILRRSQSMGAPVPSSSSSSYHGGAGMGVFAASSAATTSSMGPYPSSFSTASGSNNNNSNKNKKTLRRVHSMSNVRSQQQQQQDGNGSVMSSSSSLPHQPLLLPAPRGRTRALSSSGGSVTSQRSFGSRSLSPSFRGRAGSSSNASFLGSQIMGAVPKPMPRQVTSFMKADQHLTKYDDYGLAQSLLRFQKKRIASFKLEGRYQVYTSKSNDGWISTLFVLKARALDWMGLPFAIAVIHAVIYTIIQEIILFGREEKNERLQDTSEIFFALVLNLTLSSLLEFRLNRASRHYWEARGNWTEIVNEGRSFVGGMISHANHDILERDHAIRWLCAFMISIMELLRGASEFPLDHFAGLLTLEEVHALADNPHPPVYATNRVRYHLKKVFAIDENTPIVLAQSHIRHLDYLEFQLDNILDGCGGLQRVKSTPLPMAVVTQLRTLLIGCIILLPYIWGPSWRWRTIPIVAVAAYAWFGMEASSAEMESPFGQDRANSLNMDGFCIGFLQTVQQQVVNHADEDIKLRTQARAKSLLDDDTDDITGMGVDEDEEAAKMFSSSAATFSTAGNP